MIKQFFAALLLFALIMPNVLHAQFFPAPAPPGGVPGAGGGGGTAGEADFGYVRGLGTQTGSVIQILLVLVVSVALLLFFWGLALFILKADDETERQKGRNIMIWGIIALAVIVSVWGLVQILQNLFGVGEADNQGAPSVGSLESLGSGGGD